MVGQVNDGFQWTKDCIRTGNETGIETWDINFDMNTDMVDVLHQLST
jgi:hypothetical protein